MKKTVLVVLLVSAMGLLRADELTPTAQDSASSSVNAAAQLTSTVQATPDTQLSSTAQVSPTAQPASSAAVSGTAQSAAKSKGPRAIITMAKGGQIVIEFFPEAAPKTVDNFIKLSKKGFYNGLTFHRVEPGFVVQGGDPNGNGTGGPGYTIPAEFNDHLHERGAVAMARASDPDSAGSQFYICLAPAHFLDHNYTVFGQVVSGMDVVDKIQIGDVMKTVKIKK
jgi:peptidyl-prolyl cis-trans isomerase B (cyclophilin B)